MGTTNLTYEGLQELVSQIEAKYATIASVPTRTSDITNDSDFQTGTQVSNAITSAISGVTQFDYQIVSELPVTGVKGVIYLLPNSGFGTNVYDEYIWIESGDPATGSFELFGTKEVEVVEYVGDGTYVTIVDGTGANAGKKVVQLVSDKAGLIDTALQGITSTGSSVVVTGSGTTKNLEVSQTIQDGAALGATSLQGVGSTGSSIVVSGTGASKNLEVAQSIQDGAAAGATALQPEDITAITNPQIDALFA